MAAFSSNETEVLERTVDEIRDAVQLHQVWTEEKKLRVLKWAEENALQRICLQFPDDLLEFSVGISTQLQEAAGSAREFFILADTTYCPCCVDEVGAEHVLATGLVHFGRACLTKLHTAGLKVLYVFTEEPLNGKALTEQLRVLGDDERLAVFYSSSVVHKMAEIKEALADRKGTLIARLAIDEAADVLQWCTEGTRDFQPFTCIYIGQDDETFFNLCVSTAAGKWLRFDNRTDTLQEASVGGSGWLRKRMFYIEKCKDAQTLGIVHGTVSSSGHLDISRRIQALAKAHGMRTIVISVGKLNTAKLANFQEIDCFVLIGCPQNTAYTNSREFYKPLVSVFECELALNPLWRDKMPEIYSTDFKELLQNGRLHSQVDNVAEQIDRSDISLITGSVRGAGRREGAELANGNTDLMHASANVVAERTAADALRERTWRGLEQNLGQDEVATIQQGRSGLAMRYEENPVE